MRRKIEKDDLLEAGLELMHLKGYGSTGIKDITDHIQIPKGSFYNHFKSKEEFGLALIRHYTAKKTAGSAVLLGNARLKPLKRIRLALQADMEDQKNSNDYRLGCFVGNLCQELADVDDTFNAAISEALGQMRSGLIKCLQEAIDNKDIHPKYSAAQLTDYIVNGWQGALLRMKADKTRASMELFLEVLFDKVLK